MAFNPQIVNPAAYNLVPDTSNLANLLSSALSQKAKSDKAAKDEADLLSGQELQKDLQTTALDLIDVSKMPTFEAKKSAILKMAEREHNRDGGDPKIYLDLLASSDNDTLDAGILHFARRAGDTAGQLKSALDEKDPNTNIGKARQDLSRGVITQEEFNQIKAGTKTYTQGTGAMAGYVFDSSTGEFTINPEIKASLDRDAQEKLKTDGMLDSKKIADINDKVSGLTKSANDIVESAKSLEGLKERGTPAAQIAAVFKFMKANDPTSTVREGEQGMVYSAQGPMAAFAAKINQLMGEGGLSKSNFADLVDTAKSLANSAVTSTKTNVTGYLDVLSDKIPASDYKKLLLRVPGTFKIIKQGGSTELDPALLEFMTPEERALFNGTN